MFTKKTVAKPGAAKPKVPDDPKQRATEIQSIVGTGYSLDRIMAALQTNNLDINKTITQLKLE